MQRRSRPLLWLVIAGLGILSLLNGCGQKGPLYLPPADESEKSSQNQE